MEGERGTALSWRWSALPLISMTWLLLLMAVDLAYLKLDLESVSAYLIVFVGLVATGIVASYVLQTSWSVLIAPVAVYAGIACFVIQADKGLDWTWEIFPLLSAILLVALFLTTGAAAWVSSYLMTRLEPLSAGSSARRLLPLVLVLIVYSAFFAAWIQTGLEEQLAPWEILVAIPALWVLVLVLLVIGAKASDLISRRLSGRGVALPSPPGSYSLAPVVLAFTVVASIGAIYALNGAMYPRFSLGSVLIGAAIGAVFTGCFAAARTDSSVSDRLIGILGITFGMLAALPILFAVY